MRSDDRYVVAGLVLLMLVLWLGFLLHHSPDFAGSAWGGVFAVAGATLMLAPLAYTVVKRIEFLRKAVTARVGMQRLLQVHVYAGIAGAILALIHTGHKFQSVIGVTLTALTLLIVLSGFVGRYLLSFIGEDVRDRRNRLEILKVEYQRRAEVAQGANAMLQIAEAGWAGGPQILPLVESIADLEYGLGAEERLQSFFRVWLRFHLSLSLILYTLLGLHIWASVEFGLRWFT